MLLGYNTNGFSSHRLHDTIAIVAGLGYRSIAITVDHHSLDPYAANAEQQVAEVAALLQEHKLVPVLETGARFFLDPWNKHQPTLLHPNSQKREIRSDFVLRCLDIASSIGAGVVSLWSGHAEDGGKTEELDTRLATALLPLCEQAEACGIMLGFEPEPGMHIASMGDFDRLQNRFEHPAFGLTLDLGHAHLTEESVAATIERYRKRIVNVHVEGMHKPTHDHRPPWDSEYDVPKALALLAKHYMGPATLELSRNSHEAVVVARRSAEFLRDFL